jgi:hypothetical protein
MITTVAIAADNIDANTGVPGIIRSIAVITISRYRTRTAVVVASRLNDTGTQGQDDEEAFKC